MTNEETLARLQAWIQYDRCRGEYEAQKYYYDEARTTAAANHYRPIVIKARQEYAVALKILNDLGYDPYGCDPEPEEYFTRG